MGEFYEAHKTIWLQVDPDGEVPVNIKYPICEGATWCQDQINGTDVKYIRADLVDELKQQRDDMEEAFAQWGSERGYNVNLCDRDAFMAAWKIAYAIGRRDADADWVDDVTEVEARLKAADARRAKNAKHNLGAGTQATGEADAEDEGRGTESLPDAEEPGMARAAEVEAESDA